MRARLRDPLEDLALDAEIDDLDLVGRPPLAALQRVVDLAARVCGCAHAEVHVLTSSEQHTVAAASTPSDPARREDSLCGRMLSLEDDVVAVSDARQHPVFHDSPFVGGPGAGVVSYAAAKLRAANGRAIGTLCVFDDEERGFAPWQLDVLDSLGATVCEILEMQRRGSQLLDVVTSIIAERRELSRSNSSLETFAGQVSHDLQGPLATVRMALGLLEERLVTGPENTAAPVTGDRGTAPGGEQDVPFLLHRAQAATRRMNTMISEVLDLAVAGGAPHVHEVDLHSLVVMVLEDLAAQSQGVEVELAPMPWVHADSTVVRVVLHNLLSNAVKFSADAASPHVRVAAEQRGRSVRVSVSDNGPGVPAHLRERIFGWLARGDATKPGLGIGLATCARLLSAHGGRLGVEEVPEGSGARFWFEVPAMPVAAAAAPPSAR